MLVALRMPQKSLADVALLAAVLKDEEFAQSLVEIHLSPLENQSDGGAVSRETLRAYFAAGCNASTAAAALEVARHYGRTPPADDRAEARPPAACMPCRVGSGAAR